MDARTSALEGLYATGIWLLDKRRPLDAVPVFRTMMVLAPADERAWLGLGMAHEALGEQTTALRLYETAAHASPAPRCHVARARILRAFGKDDDAELALDAALATDDDDVARLVAWERRAA